MSTFILLTTEPENWAPKELEKKAKAAGFDVQVIDPDNAYISLTEDPFIAHDGTRFTGADVCIPRLSEDNLEYKVAMIDHLAKMGVKVLNSGQSLRAASNKVETQILLNNAGIKTPRSAVFTNEDQAEKAIEAIGGKFPIIIKTIRGTHGVGVIRADSLPSARSIIQQLVKSGEQFMVQEFIEHSESARVLILNGIPLAAVMRSIPDGDFRSNAHQGAELKVHEPSQAELDAAIKSAQILNINLAAVDYILSDGEVIMLEVNGSPGFEAMQKVITNIDIAEKIIEYCSELAGQQQKDVPSTPVEPSGVAIEDDAPIEPIVELPAPEAEAPASESEVEIAPHNTEDTIIGTITHVVIKMFNNEEPIEARVDTGAHLSSLHGSDIQIDGPIIKFKFNDITYKFHLLKQMKVKQSDNDEAAERPVIRVDLVLNGTTLRNVEMTVTDREHMEYEVLLGRQTLAAAGVLVNPAAGLTSTDANTEELATISDVSSSGNEEE